MGMIVCGLIPVHYAKFGLQKTISMYILNYKVDAGMYFVLDAIHRPAHTTYICFKKIYDDDDQQTIFQQETQVQDKKLNRFKPRIDTHKGIYINCNGNLPFIRLLAIMLWFSVDPPCKINKHSTIKIGSKQVWRVSNIIDLKSQSQKGEYGANSTINTS